MPAKLILPKSGLDVDSWFVLRPVQEVLVGLGMRK